MFKKNDLVYIPTTAMHSYNGNDRTSGCYRFKRYRFDDSEESVAWAVDIGEELANGSSSFAFYVKRKGVRLL